MAYLRTNYEIISKQEYAATKQILDLLNNTINLYSKNEATTVFNIRKFAKFVKNTKNLSDSSRKLVKCSNPTINGFRDKLSRNIIITFFAYTPFIIAEIYLRFFYVVGLLFVKMGVLKLSKWGNGFLALNEDFEGMNSRKKEILAS
jgi:hypothetical protein